MSHNKINPTSGQKRLFYIHLIVYIIATIAQILIHRGQESAAKGWVYPWHAWIIAAWGLGIIGHMCALWTSYEDPGMVEYERQTQNG